VHELAKQFRIVLTCGQLRRDDTATYEDVVRRSSIGSDDDTNVPTKEDLALCQALEMQFEYICQAHHIMIMSQTVGVIFFFSFLFFFFFSSLSFGCFVLLCLMIWFVRFFFSLGFCVPIDSRHPLSALLLPLRLFA
jgi:hypothetical protein